MAKIDFKIPVPTLPHIKPWRRETRAVVKLATLLAVTQLVLMGIVTTETIMMGWLGTEPLAAGALAGHYFWILEFLGQDPALASSSQSYLRAMAFSLLPGLFIYLSKEFPWNRKSPP